MYYHLVLLDWLLSLFFFIVQVQKGPRVPLESPACLGRLLRREKRGLQVVMEARVWSLSSDPVFFLCIFSSLSRDWGDVSFWVPSNPSHGRKRKLHWDTDRAEEPKVNFYQARKERGGLEGRLSS